LRPAPPPPPRARTPELMRDGRRDADARP
jgi:hypothetical protein